MSELEDLEFRIELLENSIIVAEKAADDLEKRIDEAVLKFLGDESDSGY